MINLQLNLQIHNLNVQVLKEYDPLKAPDPVMWKSADSYLAVRIFLLVFLQHIAQSLNVKSPIGRTSVVAGFEIMMFLMVICFRESRKQSWQNKPQLVL